MRSNLLKITFCFLIGIFLFLEQKSLVMGYTSDSEQLRKSEQSDLETMKFLNKAKTKEEQLRNWEKNLKSENYIVQRQTILNLSYYKVKSAVPYLINIVNSIPQKEQDYEMQMRAIEALGKIGGRSAADFLISKIKEKKITPEKNVLVFQDIVRGLSLTNDAKAVDTIFPFLTHSDSSVRKVTAEAMALLANNGNLGVAFHYQGTAQGHEPVYQDPDKYNSVVDKEKVCPVLIQLLSDKEGNVRASAASALGLIRYKKAIPYLEKLLNDPFVIEGTRRTEDGKSEIIQRYSVREAAKMSLRILSERYLKEF